ncbi:MAG: hypothetical protein RIE73_14715 [Coleofasciculus sp. C1-SOL-03]|uniref:hypothetical protein n=1 Tax=Coleofasciculus sp. C1-SOL-03 TaxID=3069522 RepID=UPI0032F64567
MGCRVWGVGCRVWGVGCGVSGVGCREKLNANPRSPIEEDEKPVGAGFTTIICGHPNVTKPAPT